MSISTRIKFYISCILMGLLNVKSVLSEENATDYKVDSSFSYLKSNLYISRKGEYFLKSMRANLKDEPEGWTTVYLKRFGYRDNDYLFPKLSEVIEPSSWERVSYRFYRDVNNLYCFHYDSSGGYINKKKGSDPQALKFWQNGEWKKPNEIHKEYRAIEEKLGLQLDVQSQVISSYATDGQNIFYKCGDIEGADTETFVVDNVYKWWAIDKNRIYEGDESISLRELEQIIEEEKLKVDDKSKRLVIELEFLKEQFNKLQGLKQK